MKSLVSILLVLTLLVGCAPKQKEDNKLRIVTTTGMIQDAAQRVVGDHAHVTALMGPAVDPHLYKVTHGDLERLTQADVIFYNGLHLEGKMSEVLDKLAHRKTVIAVADNIPRDRLREVAGFGGNYDPHIWFNVDLWKNAVISIQMTLSSVDKVHADEYEANAKAYLQQLDSLHHSISAELLSIPEDQRVLITAHDAFGYFGEAYNIEVRGLQGISTVTEFGLRDRVDLINYIIDRKVKSIFIESSVNPKSIEAIISGCREKGWDVKLGGQLFSDAMGAAGTPEGSYIGMVSANVKTIVEALK